ncbi:hypothetical protein TWF506_004640 [Arthrobotrys conoides]|uniref:Uncharacterized protein n=1 Tax=Arthrobotrys conoides TaxID=74498 RepID=A0AAN8RI08_9PEZI
MSLFKDIGPHTAPQTPTNEITFNVTILFDKPPGLLALSYKVLPSTILAAVTCKYEKILAQQMVIGELIYFSFPGHVKKDKRYSFRRNGLVPEIPGGIVRIKAYPAVPTDVENRGRTSARSPPAV